jgi:hydroxyethylthiazole kinase-like uncharacterized protein yjeF
MPDEALEILTSAQMRAIEAAQIESGAVTGAALMERAGAGVVAAITARWPEPGRAVVLCGPGNNGGDGYVIARVLAVRGWDVALWALAPPATPDARAMAALWRGPVLAHLAEADLAGAVVVDALFGTGLTRDVPPAVWGALAMAQGTGAQGTGEQGAGTRLVAVDLMSGICADTGALRGAGAPPPRAADLTVTFQARKRGHVLLPGAALAGPVEVVDLGLAPRLRDIDPAQLLVAARPSVRLAKTGGHKYDHGAALVIAGAQGGAARLAARAALRVGAGLVTLMSPPGDLPVHGARLDAVMLRPERDLGAALADRRLRSVCLGPGLGLNRAETVAQVLDWGGPCVLDADALTLIARDPGLRARLHGACVLTPHGGEFARLWPRLDPRDKVAATCAAAADCGAVVLFKGPDTVIAEPDGWPQVHSATGARAAPWLATAGAGDVLAGLIAGLLARGFPGAEAAATAAWLHVEAARAFGPGLIAEDLPDALPGVLRRGPGQSAPP